MSGPGAAPGATPGNPPGASAEGHDGARSVVVLDIGGRRVALDAADARGVARPDDLTLVRGAAPALRALVAVHGKVAAVVDPRAALGLEPLGDGDDLADQQLLVVSGGGGRFALLVDDVDVASLPPSPARPDADGGSDAVVGHDGDEIPLLGLHPLVASVLADPSPEAWA